MSEFIPDRWTIEPPQQTLKLAAGEVIQFPFDIRLKNAFYGKQPIRVDFKVEADEPFRFSVYRKLEVGPEDLTLDVKSHLDKDGTLVVEQVMTNSAERRADFRCYFYAKGHRQQRLQVYRLGTKQDRKVYRLPDGNVLVGSEMLLETEELNGPHVLNYRFIVAAEALKIEPSSEKYGDKPADAEDKQPAKEDSHRANSEV